MSVGQLRFSVHARACAKRARAMLLHPLHKALVLQVTFWSAQLHTAASAASALTKAISLRPEGNATCGFDGPDGLFEWVKGEGGFIDSRLELSSGPNSDSSERGIFAKSRIKKGEVLLTAPWELIITGNTSLKRSRYRCSMVKSITKELRLGRCSRFWPHIKVMNEQEIPLPNAWPMEDLALIADLPPQDWTRHTEWYKISCKGDLKDPVALRALLLSVSRSDEWGLTPVYGMLNHRYGDWRNVDTQWRENVGVMVTATQDIKAGSQLYSDYGEGGAPRIFRDYAFVEQTPAEWYFDDGKIHFSFIVADAGEIQWPPIPDDKADEHYEAFVRGAKSLLSTLERPLDDKNFSASPYAQLAVSYREAFAQALRWALQDVANSRPNMEL